MCPERREQIRQERAGERRGGEPQYWMIATIDFASDEALQAALRSDAFRAVGRDEAQLLQATGGSAEMLFGSDI